MLKTLIRFRNDYRLSQTIVNYSNTLNLEELENSLNVEVEDDLKAKEDEIMRKRNKSGLTHAHRNFVNERVPFDNARHWSHGTLKYNRKLYGKYGNSSNFNPSLCWDKSEIREKIEYEKVAYPYTVQEMMEMTKQQRLEKDERIRKRQEDIIMKLGKLETWKKELAAKIHKKESEALAAKTRKDKLIEDVRRHFGYKVDPKDEKFKEALEAKEKEEKKILKENRKKLKEERMLGQLLGKKEEAAPKTDETVKE